MPPEILALFRAFKPYKGGNDALWALNKLCNAKKHCALIPFDIGRANVSITQVNQMNLVFRAGKPANINFGFLTQGFQGGMSVQNPNWNAEKYEITLGSIPREISSHFEGRRHP